MKDDRPGPDHRSFLLGLSQGFMASRVFLTAVELDLFAALGDRSASAEELAEELGADHRGLRLLLNALAGLQLLDLEIDRFSNRKGLAHLLLSRQQGGEEGFAHAARLWDTWSELTDAVRSGRPPAPGPGQERERALGLRQFALERGHELEAFLDLPEGGCVLDLGGGSGERTLELLRRRPRARAVIFDCSGAALEIAGAETERAGLGERVRLQEGDFFRDDLGEGYDLVLLSSVLCLFAERQNLLLLGRARDALKEGGAVAVRDVMTDESETEPVKAALFAVHLLLTTGEGRAYPHARVTGWLREAGFEKVRRIPQGVSQLVLGRRAPSR